jgi:hypothetical protein
MVDGRYRNAEGNQIRDFVAANMRGAGIYLRGAAGTRVERATLYGSEGTGGLVADGGDPGLGGSCGPSNPDGCSLIARDVLSLHHRHGYGFLVSGQDSWLIERSNASGNRVDYAPAEPPDDDAGHIRHSRTVDAPEIGLGDGQCLIRVPADSALGKIGATIVDRYDDVQLTRQDLWDPTTGAFPCGAVVAGINDGPIRCTNVHERLHVNAPACRLQASAAGDARPAADRDAGERGSRGSR